MFEWIEANIPPWFYITVVVHLVVLGTVAYLILLERKTASWVQDRIGPNRVGLGGLLPILPEKIRNMHMFGLGQPLADGIKFIVKEDYRAKGVDKTLFTIAPIVMIIVVIISIAVIPWGGIRESHRTITVPANVVDTHAYLQSQLAMGDTLSGEPQLVAGTSDTYVVTYRYAFQVANLNIGVLFVLASLSLAVYGVVIGGWASNNKYSFLGGLRATANMISYEIPLGVAVLTIVVMFGSLDMGVIVEKQCHNWGHILPAWNVFTQPLTFIMFLICIHAEANRAPFDLAEAEQELVGGYHTEYSAMRFALFFLAEYAGMITTSAVCVALFFGGWDFWGLRGPSTDPAVSTTLAMCIARGVVFFVKTLIVVFIFMWTRWSLPRFRFDQMMQLAWRGLIPISLFLLMATSVVVYLFNGQSIERVHGWMAIALLGSNLLAGAIILIVSTIIPPAPATNRRVRVIGSRYNKTPVPAGMN